MKRQDLKDLGIEDKAVIDSIMNLYGDGINEAKADVEKLKSDMAEKEKTIAELNDTIKGFDGKDETLKELQDKVANYEKSELERQEAEKQKQIDADLKNRFVAVLGENKFKHADIETGRFNAFKESLSKDEFKGKGDADIFAEITKDMDCFVNPQQVKVEMPGGNFNKNADDLAKARDIMGLPKNK